MTTIRRALLFGFVFLCLVRPVPCAALENGTSNRQPGSYGDFLVAVAPGPGLSVATSSYLYRGNFHDEDKFGRIVGNVEFFQQSLAMTYRYPGRLMGARWVSSASIPFVRSNDSLHFEGTDEAEHDKRALAGDPYLSPISLYWRRRRLHVNAYQGISIPLGTWREHRLSNASTHYWSVDTNLAVSWWHRRRGLELATVLGHTWNDRNPDSGVRSGQELHLEAMVNKTLFRRFQLGVHGFHQRQVSGDDDANASTPRARATGLGPALGIDFGKGGERWSLVAKWLAEIDVRGRSSGHHVYVNLNFER